MDKLKITIIGAGNGGQSMAAHLASLNQNVILYDINQSIIDSINQRGHITSEGILEATVNVKATTNIEQAMNDTDVVLVTTTGNAHQSVAESIAPYVKDGTIIMIFPGYWGALEFRNTFNKLNIKEKVYIAETESLIYTTRAIEPGHVRIRKIKEELHFSSLPAIDAMHIKNKLQHIYPQLVIADNVLVTTLNNCNPIFHVPITICNASRIENGDEFFFYPDGATPSVVNIMEKLDQERLEIGKKLNINLSTSKELLERFYETNEKTLYKSIQNNPAYKTGKAPTTLKYRYIYEDIPYGLYPMVLLGKQLNLSMQYSNMLIDFAEILMDDNLREKGITLDDLGLKNISNNEIVNYLIGH